MEYIIAGFLFGFGWHVVKLLYSVVEELLFCRLHKAEWYSIAVGKQSIHKGATGDASVKNRIGF